MLKAQRVSKKSKSSDSSVSSEIKNDIKKNSVKPIKETSTIESSKTNLMKELASQPTKEQIEIDLDHEDSAEFEAKDIEFSTVIAKNEKVGAYQADKKKGSGGKVNRLKKLLQEAERKRERLQALTSSDDDLLKKRALTEQWNDALVSAAGGKPLVVSSTGGASMSELKIKKALKRREKKKQKSADQWSIRLQNLENDQQEKLQKREDNLKHKKHRATEPAEQPEIKKSVPIRKPGQPLNNTQHANTNNKKKESHTPNDNNHKQKSNTNRAGFEGKKSDGKFLNQ